MFGIVTAGLTLIESSSQGWLLAGYRATHGLLWTTAGSVALGALLGLLMDFWAARAKESGEAMILSIGAVLIAVGASRWLGLSPLISTLALGATVANASQQGDRLLCALGRADPPLYAAFFVLAGAELVPSSVLGLGMIGAGYTIARTIGKVVGARIGCAAKRFPSPRASSLGIASCPVLVACRRPHDPDSDSVSGLRGDSHRDRPGSGGDLRGCWAAAHPACSVGHGRGEDHTRTTPGDRRLGSDGLGGAPIQTGISGLKQSLPTAITATRDDSYRRYAPMRRK